MILTSLINVKTDWKPNPYISINDDKCDLYAVNLFFYHNNEWYNVYEKPDLNNNNFLISYFQFRMKWRFKVWGFVDEQLKLLYDEIYDERDKKVIIHFSSHIYSSHEKWLDQSLDLSKKYRFHPIIVSRFSERLKIYSPNGQHTIISPQEYEQTEIKNDAYAEYYIRRNKISMNSSDDWETGGIFTNNTIFFRSWHHKNDWMGMTDEQLFNDIMNYE